MLHNKNLQLQEQSGQSNDQKSHRQSELQTDNEYKLCKEIARRSIIGNIAYVFLYSWILYATTLLHHSFWLILSCGMVILLAAIVRSYLSFAFEVASRNLKRWHGLFVSSTLIIALMWCSIALNALFHAWPEHQINNDLMLISILIFAIASGGINVVSLLPSLWKAFVSILLLPLIIGLLLLGSQTAIALAVLLIFGLLFSLSVGQRIYKDYWQRLKHENMLEQQTKDLADARDEALNAARSKASFLANMSHEIRTPMNGVLGMANLLLSTSLSHKQHSFAHAIKRSGDALLLIINDILDFSKIEAGKLDLEQRPIDLRRLVEDVADLLSQQAFNKNIELITQLEPGLPQKLLADGGRLKQILINLAGNAIKFTPAGEVVMAVRVISRDKHTVKLSFSVRDSGIGIEPEKQKHIFQAFTQSDTSTTRQFGGTGLGLAICNQLVSMMGGEIHLQSKLSQGSVFSFELALKLDHTGLDQATLWPSLQGAHALIVDDNLTNCKILHYQLQTWGISNRMLQQPQQALAELRRAYRDEHAYDVIMLDMHMPGMDGIELTRAIRDDALFADVPIIMMTSGGMDEEKAEAASAGIDAYLCKPVHQSDLHQSLCNILQAQAKPLKAKKRATSLPCIDHIEANLLLAEDNDVNQTIAKIMLEEFGCSVHIVSDGQQAVDAFLTGGMDIILMDCQMPVLDGYAATRKIRQAEKSANHNPSHIPIIALTAHAMQGDRETCLDAGMDDYLTKPFSREQLQEILCIHLPEHWQTTPTSEPEAMPKSNDADHQETPSRHLDTTAINLLPGGDSVRHKVMTMFLKSMPNLLTNMQTGLAQDDSDSIMRASHTLKSSSAMIGALELSELCKQIELISSNAELTGIECILQEALKNSLHIEHEIKTLYLTT